MGAVCARRQREDRGDHAGKHKEEDEEGEDLLDIERARSFAASPFAGLALWTCHKMPAPA